MTCGRRRSLGGHGPARGPNSASTASSTTKGKVTMHNEPQLQHRPPQPQQPRVSWRTPDFTVVDTALEVTAYSLREK